MITAGTPFFVTGGTLRPDAPSYVERRADSDLYEGLSQGEFCYVLTSRQMGKSSLMVRTASRLREAGVAVVVLDLTSIGQNLSAEQWYDGLLGLMGPQLDLEDELEEFWLANARQGPLHRWMAALRKIVLPRCPGRIVIFVDEIDAVRSLPFSTDEFFAAIRECYNHRSEDPEFARLTFCLLGVATPSDLIRDTRTTPFNIGRRIELTDFTPAEAAPLAVGLDGGTARRGDGGSRTVLGRILHWTGGHPYLTQRLCRAVAEAAAAGGPAAGALAPSPRLPVSPSAAEVDRLCAELFLDAGAREKDDNLLFVRDRLLRSEADRAGLLDLYRQVWRRRRVRADDTNRLVNLVQLAGIASVVDGHLRVRNRIYSRVFDAEWVTLHMPDAELRRQRAAYRRGLWRATAIYGSLGALLAVTAGIAWSARNRARSAELTARRANAGLHVALAKERKALEGKEVERLHALQEAERADRNEKLAGQNAAEARKHGDAERAMLLRDAASYQKSERWRRDHLYPQTGYYAHLLKRWGVLDGLDPVTPEEASHRQTTFRVVRHGLVGPVEEVAAVNGWGNLTPQHELTSLLHGWDTAPSPTRECRWTFERATSGRVTNEKAYDQAGRQVYELNYTSPNTAYFINARAPAHAPPASGASETTGSSGFFLIPLSLPQARARSGASYVGFTWSRQGFETNVRFADAQGRPQPDVDGRYGERRSYDERGRPLRIECLDGAGKPMVDRNQIARVSLIYDRHGNVCQQEFSDARGFPTLHRDGFHRIRSSVDRYGNVIRVAYFGIDGKPCLCKDQYAAVTRAYDAHGNLSAEAYLGPDGNPTLSAHGVARIIYACNKWGNSLEEEHFGLDGKPTLCSHGVFRVTHTYDDRGNTTAWSHFGLDRKPALHKQGYARETAEYDDRGNRIEWAYWGPDGKLILHPDGYARERTKYDDRGNCIEWAYFGVDGKPTLYRDGYARTVKSYDTRGNWLEWRCFGVDGRPTRDRSGIARSTARYDDQGKEIEWACYGLDGKPTLNDEGYSRIVKAYNAQGKLVEQAYVAPDGKPTLCKSGYAATKQKYDNRGNITELAFLGVDGKPTTRFLGLAKLSAQYDSRGNITGMSLFDDKGLPALVGNAFHSVVMAYDARGNRSGVAYFDTHGKPFRGPGGVARTTFRYDERGNQIAWANFGVDGRPTLHQDGNYRGTARYDARGNQIEIAFFDVEDNPTLVKGGYARKTTRYDSRNRPIGLQYFGRRGESLKTVVKISEVLPNSQAERNGLRKEDAIISIDGRPVADEFALQKMRRDLRVRLQSFRIKRGENTRTVQIRPGPIGIRFRTAILTAPELSSSP
jgi:hypothetical protein